MTSTPASSGLRDLVSLICLDQDAASAPRRWAQRNHNPRTKGQGHWDLAAPPVALGGWEPAGGRSSISEIYWLESPPIWVLVTGNWPAGAGLAELQ